MMGYQTKFDGIKLGSSDFRQKLGVFADELVRAGKINGAQDLVVHYGSFDEIRHYLDISNLEPVYNGDRLVIIADRQGAIYQTMRGVEVRGNSSVSRVYTLRRYKGFEVGKEPYSLEMLYFLSVTLERFVFRDKLAYRRTLSVQDQPTGVEFNFLLDRQLRPKLFGRYNQEILLDKEVYDKYKSLTRDLASIIFLRSLPENDHTAEQVLEKALNKHIDKTNVLTNPNQLIDIILRFAILAIDAIIMDHQRYKYSGDTQEITNKINLCCKEAEELFLMVNHSRYDPKLSVEVRHQMSEAEAKSFEGAYKEIIGDLLKAVITCGEMDMVKRRNFCNFQNFKSRVEKIGRCLDDIDQIEQQALKIILPDSEYMVEMKKFFESAKAYISISASDESDIVEANQDFTHAAYVLRRYSKALRISSDYMLQKIGQVIQDVTDEIPNMQRSKRGSGLNRDKVLASIANAPRTL